MFRFLAAVMVAGSALANGIVRGVVMDPNSVVIPRSEVRLLPEGSGTTKYRVETGDNGEFIVENVSPGAYVVRAHHVGFMEGAVTATVIDGEIADAGRVPLRLAPCDAPGVNCFYISASSDPPPPPSASGSVALRMDCGVDLDLPTMSCPDNANRVDSRADLQAHAGGGGAIYLTAINGARISDCATKSDINQPIRVDGLGPGNDWCVETNAKHPSHVFIGAWWVVEPGAEEVRLWIVTRK